MGEECKEMGRKRCKMSRGVENGLFSGECRGKIEREREREGEREREREREREKERERERER